MLKNGARWLAILMAGAAAVVIILALMLPFWLLFKADYAPQLASDFIIEHTPPDNAIALQNVLGPLAFPSALLGGIMFVGSIGLFGGFAYGLIKKWSPIGAILAAALVVPALVGFLFPTTLDTPEHRLALLPLLFTGPLITLIARRDSPLLSAESRDPQITRRAALSRLAIFSLGGILLSVIDSIPVYQSAVNSQRSGQHLFDFKPPVQRVQGFDVPDLSPEITPVDNFYIMRKFATPIPVIPPDWKLTVGGLVDHELSFSLDDLTRLLRTDIYLTRECVSNPVGGNLISTALMSGIALKTIMDQAGLKRGVIDLVFYGRDGYSESIPVNYALEHGVLTYAMNGDYLPGTHGAPLRLEVPGLYGFKNMKWLDRIEAIDHHDVAIWESEGWTESGIYKTMSRIDAVKLVGDHVVIAGIAFAGTHGISAVEVQINGGNWLPAILNAPPLSGQTWVQWRLETAQRGALTIRVRAVDGTGAPQIEKEQQQFPDGASGLQMVRITI